jgi:RND family efflux transporter MFP subunit
MKSLIYILITAAILGLLVVRLLSNKKEAESKIYHYNKEEAVLISTDTVVQRNLSAEYSYTGTFEPFREGKVMAESQGKITEMHAEQGDYLNEGKIVAKLDDELLKLQLEAINVQIKSNERDMERYRILAEADAVQRVQLEKIQLALDAAIIQRKTIEEQIERTSIIAPFNGIVTQKFTEKGTVVSPPVPVIQLTDISKLKMTLSIPESELKHFSLNQKLEVVADALPGRSFKGTVKMIGSRGDMAHNFPVQIELANTPDNLIKAGMFGSVSLTRNEKMIYSTISKKAITGSSLKPQVYVIENDRASLRDVNVVFENGEYAAIAEGLDEYEIVAISGFINLRDGSHVATEQNKNNLSLK